MGEKLPLFHVGRLFIIERLENIITLPLIERNPAVDFGADDGDVRRCIIRSTRFPQLRQEQQSQKERRNHICRNRTLIPLRHRILIRRNPRILHHGIQSLQSLRPSRELFHGFVAGEIELPYLHHSLSPCAFLDGFLRRFSLFEVSHGEDDFCGVEAREVAGCFETKTDVGTCYYDGLGGVWGGGVGERDEELAVDEAHGCLERRGRMVGLVKEV